jgi:hypothetical protein
MTNKSRNGDLSVAQKAQDEPNAGEETRTEPASSQMTNRSTTGFTGTHCDLDRCGHTARDADSRCVLHAVDGPATDPRPHTDRFCQVVRENFVPRHLDREFNGDTSDRDKTDRCTATAPLNTAGDACLSDRALFRQYRDDFLTRAKKGKLYTKLAFMISEKALAVFDDNPQLMPQAKELIEANKERAIDGLNEEAAYSIQKGDEVISFLQVYSKEAPPLLKILTYLLRKEIEKKQKKGELSFVSDQKTQRQGRSDLDGDSTRPLDPGLDSKVPFSARTGQE